LLAGRDRAQMERVPLPTGVRRRVLSWDASVLGMGSALADTLDDGTDLDAVVAAAGILGRDAEGPTTSAAAVMTTNLTGIVEALEGFAALMTRQRHGTLIVLSSLAAVRARRSSYVYSASKAGLDTFTQGLADHLRGTDVKVLLVRPGFVHGRMTDGLPAAPFATTPQGVGEAVGHALARDRGVVWVPPVLALVAPVLRVIPRTVWRRLDL
jgi:decaprenylphospho-beta-D-erythro-pentofuranosid-2-ulose 2-reductase